MVALPAWATRFAQIGEPRAYAFTAARVAGSPREWVAMECRPGDRGAADSTFTSRMGFDGWPHPHDGDAIELSFGRVFDEASTARRSGDWLDFFEVHHLAKPGDVASAGPIAMFKEWSVGAGREVARLKLAHPTFDAAGRMVKVDGSQFYDLPPLLPNVAYRFVLRYRLGAHPRSFVRLWINERKVVNHNGPVGFGDRRLYDQHRWYGNERYSVRRMLAWADAPVVLPADV